jgi:hypothetical protein
MSMRFGDLLVKAKVITEGQLSAALAEQKRWGGRLGEILVRMNILTEELLVRALSKQLNLPAVDLDAIKTIPANVRAKIPPELARDLVALPLQLGDDGKSLLVVLSEPQSKKQLDVLRAASQCRIVPQLAGRQAIARAFTRFYGDAPERAPAAGAGDAFKLIDAQGKTIVKSADEIARRREAERRATTSSSPAVPAPTAVSRTGLSAAPPAANRSPSELLAALEETQRREVAALKGMVELLIQKGVFTREEYLAKVRR